MSPLLFNVFLETVLDTSPLFKKSIEAGNLICFADDILIMCDSKEDAEAAIEEFEKIKSCGLHLNKLKTQIISDLKEMKGVEEVKEIKITKKIKYLGMQISCDRQQILKDVKKCCKKYLMSIKGKIQTEDESTRAMIFSAFYRSLLIYYFTPIFAAGAITKIEIDNMEAHLKQNLLPNDIKSEILNSILDHYATPTSTVIARIAAKNREYAEKDKKVATKDTKDNVKPSTEEEIAAEAARRVSNIENRKKISIDKKVRTLMLTVAANRTLTHYGHRNFCRRHAKLIDKKRIDECTILNTTTSKKVTHYNAVLEKTSLYDLNEEELREVVAHYTRLATII